MSEFPDTQPTSRCWRDIPQHVKPRAMSREGRRRYLMAGLKTAAAIGVLTVVGVGAVWLARTWTSDRVWFSSVSGQSPVKKLVLQTNGRLNEQWVRDTLALPAKVTLMELDLAALQARLEQPSQVEKVTVSKVLPDALKIELWERAPVARLRAPDGNILLVARDGISFPGLGFTPEAMDALPLLTGVELDAAGALPKRLPGMDTVADLLARAGDLAPHLLERWTEIDISGLETDGLIEVHSRDISRIIFSKEYGFSDQLAWLDWARDLAPGPLKMVNVGLGPRVIAEPAVPETPVKSGARPAAAAPALRPAAVSTAARPPILRVNFDN
jgi:cell division septal protein FtsQ